MCFSFFYFVHLHRRPIERTEPDEEMEHDAEIRRMEEELAKLKAIRQSDKKAAYQRKVAFLVDNYISLQDLLHEIDADRAELGNLLSEEQTAFLEHINFGVLASKVASRPEACHTS